MKPALRLKVGSTYTPVDLVRYAQSTVLMDLNEGGFPTGDWDCALALEVLEHIHDVPALLKKIRAAAKRLICTYECLDAAGNIPQRRERGFFNDFDKDAFTALLHSAGWQASVGETHTTICLFVCD